MKQEVQLRFDYAALDGNARRFVLDRTEKIHNIARMTAAGIVQIGQYLTEVKERLKHGDFLKWIEREFGWTDRSARAFMQVHRAFKTEKFSNLQIDISALYLIAKPSTPEPVRADAVRRAANGEPVTHAGARALVQHFVDTGEIPDVKASLPEMIAERRRALELPSPAATREEKREETRLRQEMQDNSRRVAAMMGVVRAIEEIAHTDYAMAEVARHIERFDTPDQDWKGVVTESFSRLRQLVKELSL